MQISSNMRALLLSARALLVNGAHWGLHDALDTAGSTVGNGKRFVKRINRAIDREVMRNVPQSPATRRLYWIGGRWTWGYAEDGIAMIDYLLNNIRS